MPPVLATVTQQDRHAVATLSAPRASSVTIYLASKPDRATDGSFLSENIKGIDFLTDSEIQSGRWLNEDRVDPGTYWVMIRASADFGTCYDFDTGTLNPACADGFSNVLTLVIEKPRPRFTVAVRTYKYLREVSLSLTATPLGEKLPYRLCYADKKRKRRCLAGTLNGFSWDYDASDSLDVSTGNLLTFTTFSWYVGGAKVASRRVRVR